MVKRLALLCLMPLLPVAAFAFEIPDLTVTGETRTGNIMVSGSAGVMEDMNVSGTTRLQGLTVSGSMMMPSHPVSGSVAGVTNAGRMFYPAGISLDNAGKLTVVDLSATRISGDGSGLTNISTPGYVLPQNISLTGLTVSDIATLKKISGTESLQFVSTSLPTCNATSNVGQQRRSGVKSCYCDGSSWKNVAPAAVVSVLGVNVLVADTCP